MVTGVGTRESWSSGGGAGAWPRTESWRADKSGREHPLPPARLAALGYST